MHAQRARHAPRPAGLGRHQRQQRGLDGDAEAAAARAARLPLDRARCRRRHARGVSEAERGAQLDRVHRRAARLRRAVAEFRLRRRRRATSATTRRDAFRCARRATDRGRPTAGPATPSGPAGCRSTSCRTSTIRRSTSSSPPTIGRRRRSYRLQPRPRVDRAVPRAADHRSAPATDRTSRPRFTPDDFARIQADTVSLHAKALLPLLLKHTSRVEATGDQRGARHPAPMELRRDRATAPPTAIFQAWFLQLTRGARRPTSSVRRRRDRYAGQVLVRRRASSPTRWRPNDSPWCDNVTTPQRETCDDVVASALQQGHRRSAAPSGQRHDALAVGRRAPRDVPARARLGRGAAADPQPLGRIGGDWSTVNVGVSAADHPYEVHTDPRLPRDHRSLAGQRQPLPRRGRRVGPLRCRRTTTISCRTGAR